eukprot:CAMPEP_0113855414 /NCGR_PEP_ID=MMETSP0372-20130328/8223_1 /TAXON_ID=340204 /ORGANISM="Lankesteria abbotti" /LENGTH=559 /DNA_ID=CAMNT_0000829413 /DNA_START=236 /DNA_END=1916 /DNA_ORIENTATION=+ /assembly_acc=CAM_ASM_000359
MQNAIQQICLANGFVVDGYECELVEVEFGDTTQNPRFPEIPCDLASLEEIVEKGDDEPYGSLPVVLTDFYKRNNVPADAWVPTYFNILSGSRMWMLLFNDANEHLGPIPLISQKLNIIGRKVSRILRTVRNGGSSSDDVNFDDVPLRLSQSTQKRLKPQGHSLTPVQANHHWDLLVRCNPEFILVTLRLSNPSATTDPHKLWWKISTHFKLWGTNLSIYRAHLDISRSASYIFHDAWECFIPILALVVFAFQIGPFAITALIFLPYNIYRFIFQKDKFSNIVGAMLDPLNQRVHYVPWIFIGIENAAGIVTLFGLIGSVISLYKSSGDASYFVGYEDRVSPVTYWSQYLRLDATQLVSQWLFAIWTPTNLFAAAILLYLVRILEFSLLIPGTSFLLLTFVFALFPLLSFTLIYLTVVLAYAIITHVCFGGAYAEFSTLHDSFTMMLLSTFGLANFSYANTQTYPFLEEDAMYLHYTLLSFQILVVTIMLNMFTTIMINAYSTALDNRGPAELGKLRKEIWKTMKTSCGYSSLKSEPRMEKKPLFHSSSSDNEDMHHHKR